MTRFLPSTALLCAALASAGAPVAAGSTDTIRRAGDILQIALPAMSAVCAVHEGRGADFVGGFVAQTVIVQASKHMLGRDKINRRPNGGGSGMPSGHTSSAFFGASDLGANCLRDKPVAKALAYTAAAFVGYSRYKSGMHTPAQVLAGAAVGYLTHGIAVVNGDGSFGLHYSLSF